MLNPTPALPSSPLDIGSLFSASFRAIKQRFGLFVLIALLPTIVTIVFVAVGVVLLIAGIGASAGSRSLNPTPLVIVGVVVVLAGILVGSLIQVKAYGLMSLAAYEVAQGQRPSLGDLLQRSRGFLPRMAVVIAIAIGVVVVVYGIFFGVLAGVINAASRSGGREPAAALAGAVGLLFLLLIALVPVALFVSTKLIYTIPAVAIEGRGGLDGLTRSWTLTKGSFWRTLGYYLVGYLAVTVVGYLIGMVGQLLLVPFSGGLSTADTSDPRVVLAALGAMVPVLILLTVLQLAVSVISLPFIQSYTTYMFIDQVRRSELPAYGYPTQGYAPQEYAARPGYPQQPGYPPSAPSWQPSQGYPGQYPAPGYPAQGYGTPGQPYPGQQPPAPQPPAQGWQQSSGWTGQPPQQSGTSPDPRRAWDAPPPPAQQPPSDQGWGRPPGTDDQQR